MAPRRHDSERPPVVIDVAPAYELVMTVVTALEGTEADTYDVGPEWIAEVRARAGAQLVERTEALAFGNPDSFIHLLPLAYEAPAPRDASAFLEQLRATPATEIVLHLVQYYARDTRRMTPAAVIRAAVGGDAVARDEFLKTSHPEWSPWTDYLRAVLDADVDKLKDDLIACLSEWATRVWAPESVTILPILERDAAVKRGLMNEMELEPFIETATNGVEYVPRPGIDRIVLIPSFVNRPLVSFTEFGEVMMILYPVADESVSAFTDSPPLRLVRLSKALADEKRLRILRALGEGDMTLMELAEMFKVAKTTMHHHMIVLRSAGLVSTSVGTKRYRLRHETLPDVGDLLGRYLTSRPTITPDASAARRQAGRRS